MNLRSIRGAAIGVLAAGLLSSFGAARTSRAAAAGKPPSELFVTHCASCHGADGKADTADGKKLGAIAFADAKWREKKKSKVDKLIISVAEGRGKKMPGFKDKLKPEEIRAIVEKDVLGDW